MYASCDMSAHLDLFSTILKQHGSSVTKPRIAVFEALLGQEPLTMHELVKRVPQIDRASVYRIVSLLETLGIVLRINIGWKYKLELSEAFSAHHHHLSCTKCGKTHALNEEVLEQAIDRLSKIHGFVPSSHQIEIQGICKSCRTGHAEI